MGILDKLLGRGDKPEGGPADRVLKYFRKQHRAVQIRNPKELSSGQYCYVVVNDQIIVHIGKGNQDRVKNLFSGGKCPKHTKALILVLVAKVYGPGITIFAKKCESGTDALAVENDLKTVNTSRSFYFPDYPTVTGNQPLAKKLLDVVLSQDSSISLELAACLNLATYDGDVLTSISKVPAFRGELERLLGGYFSFDGTKSTSTPVAVSTFKSPRRETVNQATANERLETCFVSASQLQEVERRLSQRPELFGKNFRMQTTDNHLVFEVEKIRESKLRELIAKVDASTQELAIRNLGLTGKSTGDQFRTEFGSCYLVHRKGGFAGGGERDIPRSS